MLLCNHAAYGFANFYPTIVQGFNLGSTTITLLLTAPPYLLASIISFFVSYSSDQRNERSLHIAIPMSVAVVGFVISVATTNAAARYAASFLFITGCFCGNGLVYGWVGNVLNQTPEKKAIASAVINVLAQLGNVMSPYFFRSQDQPRYVLAMILLIVFAGLSGITSLLLKWDLTRANRRLREEAERNGTTAKLFTT